MFPHQDGASREHGEGHRPSQTYQPIYPSRMYNRTKGQYLCMSEMELAGGMAHPSQEFMLIASHPIPALLQNLLQRNDDFFFFRSIFLII